MRGTFGAGYSGTAPSEHQQVFTPNNWRGDGTKAGIVYCHSLGAIAQYGMFPTVGTSLAVPAILRWLADCGWPVIGGDLAGDPAGNDTGTSRVEDCRTYLQSTIGAKSGKVGLVGWSEGGGIALNYARVHPANVACMVLLQPACDYNALHAGVLATVLDAAFPPSWDSTTDAAYNPVSFASTLSGIPSMVCYATDDGTISASSVRTLIAGLNPVAVQVGTGDHGDGYLSTVDPRAVSSFLAAYI